MSCGCLGKVLIGENSLTHGHSIGRKSSRTLQSYGSAKARCFNPQKARYGIYGARGITMCPEWRDSFEAFLRDMGECPEGLTLERKDVNGNYEPGNCVWADRKVQARNRRSNITVSHQGEDMVLLDFATLMGVSYGALRRRVSDRGQDPHQAVMNMRIRASRGAVTPQS